MRKPMFALKSEDKIILLLSRLNVPEEILEEAGSLIEGEGQSFDYDRLISLAAANEVAPLLYKNLKGLAGVPENLINGLKSIYYHTVAHNTFNARELLKILGLLKANGIDAIPLKGSLASEIVFENPGLYPAGDIDILVKPSDLAETGRVLREAGYTKTKDLSECDLLANSYHLIYHNDYHSVEVHWNLAKTYFTIPPDFWWEDTTTTEFDGVTLTMLAVEKYLLYTIFRLYNHGFTPLKFLVLIAEIINKYHDEIDWNRLLTYSEEYKMKRLVFFVLALFMMLWEQRFPNTCCTKRFSAMNGSRNSFYPHRSAIWRGPTCGRLPTPICSNLPTMSSKHFPEESSPTRSRSGSAIGCLKNLKRSISIMR